MNTHGNNINKIINSIIAGLIVAAGIGCNKTKNIIHQYPATVSQDSPFALHAPFCMKGKSPACFPPSTYSESLVLDYLSDIGVRSVRLVKSEVDSVETELYEKNIGILSGISQPVYPTDMETYLMEIKETVNKHKNYVKSWNIMNEADINWKGTISQYTDLFIKTSKAIKSECPDCVVVMNLAGARVVNGIVNERGLKFLRKVLADGAIGEYFDILDFHVQGGEKDYTNLKIQLDAFKSVLSEAGLQKKIWITEFGTYEGDPTPSHPRQPDFPYQSEMQQARGLLKKYVYGLSLGVKKMFWTTMIEWYNYNNNLNDYFSNVGLINNPDTDGKSNKKLSYYTYKKMTEILENSDWDNIQTIQESNGVYIYKFIKNNKPIWVAWNDNSTEKQITISGIDSKEVRITNSVPKYESGGAVTDYNTAFETDIKTVTNETITITLNDTPIFVEGK